MITVAISLYLIGYLLAFGFEALTLHIRLAGAQVRRNAYAGFLVTACMLGNRFGASLLFPSGGFLLDKGLSQNNFLNLFAVAAAIVSVLILILVWGQKLSVSWISKLFPADENEAENLDLSERSGKDLAEGQKNRESSKKGKTISKGTVVATTVFNHLGIFIPVLAASFFLDYRATIVQLGFVFNSIGTVITIFFIERKLAINAEYSPNMLATEMRKLLLVRASVLLGLSLVFVCAAQLLF